MPILPPSLGKPVTSRTFSWKEMVIRQWGSEYQAPDHRIYNFSNGRSFDSTDMYTTGFYRRGILNLVNDETPWDGPGNVVNDETGGYVASDP